MGDSASPTPLSQSSRSLESAQIQSRSRNLRAPPAATLRRRLPPRTSIPVRDALAGISTIVSRSKAASLVPTLPPANRSASADGFAAVVARAAPPPAPRCAPVESPLPCATVQAACQIAPQRLAEPEPT